MRSRIASSTRYDVVCGKVDDLFGRIRLRYPDALACRQGCSSCCHHHLSIVPFEFAPIAEAALALPDADKAAIRTRLAVGHADSRCVLLNDAGECRVYEARPMICRSHGLPLQTGHPPVRDVCPLNFSAGPEVDDVDGDCVLDLDPLNRILALIDQSEHRGDGSRISLIDGLSAVLNASPGDLPKPRT